MPSINYARVVLGGLAAGVVANICDTITNLYLVREDGERMLQRLGLDTNVMSSVSVGVTWAVIDFIFGLLIVWTYAAVRPRLGPGPQTAITAGMVVWLPATMVIFGFMQMGIFSPDVFWKTTLLSLGTFVLASVVGAKIYKED